MSYTLGGNVIVSQISLGELVFALRPVKQKLESQMSRSPLFFATSFLVLAACQPAADAPQDPVAETPPLVMEADPELAASQDAEAVAAEVSDSMAPVAETSGAAAEPDTDAKADEHAHDADTVDGQDHDEHDHEDDHEDHDHDEHDHAAGEAHVHGLSELAISLDGQALSLSLEGALANFGLDETLRALDDPAPYTDGIVAFTGGDCSREQAQAEIRPIGDHGNLVIDMVYSCAAMAELSAVTVTAFERFSGFEEVNAVVLTDARQFAGTLTAASPDLDLE